MSEPAKLPAPEATPRRHEWDRDTIERIPANESDNGCSQTHRACVHCKLIKITMHPPQDLGQLPWIEFIYPGTHMRFRLERTPPCERKGEAS